MGAHCRRDDARLLNERGAALRFRLFEGQGDRENAPLPLFTFHDDVAPMQLYDLGDDGQPQPAAGDCRLGHLFAAIETFEEVWTVGRGDADAAVGNREGDALFYRIVKRCHADKPAGV